MPCPSCVSALGSDGGEGGGEGGGAAAGAAAERPGVRGHGGGRGVRPGPAGRSEEDRHLHRLRRHLQRQGGSIKCVCDADQESLQACWWDRASPLPLRGRDILRLIDSGLKYRQLPWHPACLPLDLSCRHVVQRLVLVFTNAQDHIWVLLVQDPAPHLPSAVAVKTHAVTWAANQVVQEAMPSSYYEHDVNTLGVFSLQHGGRQPGKTDGVCFNTLVALVPDRVRRGEDGRRLDRIESGPPPPVENPRYRWYRVQNQTIREKLLERTKNTSILPIHSLY
ncbi:8-oxo-dGDP phosphatase NUDT18-like isoform X2 [Centroberyx affinis]|uniref:8-oxo-dGDP phosphatase NUDT18-like isoform X2 n=1 Tax=Centroberyx affinis TaxID=166261 RepID=UPI003A5C2010